MDTIREDIQLTTSQLSYLERIAAVTGRSVSDLVAEAVDLYLHSLRSEAVERARRAAGRFSSGSGNGSRDHDHFLAEAYLR